MSTTAYHVERKRLGARLAGLRKQSGLSGTMLAEQLGWAQSKVSRIEAGSQTPSEDDLRAWTSAVQAPSDVVDDLLARLQVVKVEYAAWRRELRSGQVDKQTSLLNLGANATRIRNLETVVVPGLLQTPEYARYRLLDNAVLYDTPTDDLAAAVQVRMQRQQILYDPNRRFDILITEAVLRTVLCPVDVMRGQLDRLVTLTEAPNITFGVLPFGPPRLPWPPQHAFAMFDDLVLVETVGGEIILRDPEETAPYQRLWDMLHDAARYGADARALITEALAALRGASEER
jgi:transcriptional regulator with XRE-family HTH domain